MTRTDSAAPEAPPVPTLPPGAAPAEVLEQPLEEALDPSLPRTFVRKSAVHGRGLFAAERIERGRLIGVYEGPETRRNGAYVLWVEEGDREFGISGKNELRFVNHSKRANAEFRGEECYAVRTIRAGDEIVFDYGEDWD